MSGPNRSRIALGVVTLAVLFSLAALTTVSANANMHTVGAVDAEALNVPTFPLDHFWCYRTTSTPVDQQVQLQDQFDPAAPVAAVVGAPIRFCNPVKKVYANSVTKIQHPNDHLVFYLIQTSSSAPPVRVAVTNQFGRAKLTVTFPAIMLAVPTQKNTLPPPVDTDHFKCYKVDGQPLNLRVNLKDQFQGRTGLVVATPLWLCNPTIKIHNANTTPILHPESHLVCYTITITQFKTVIQTVNQFRQEQLTVKNSNILCVPSKKKVLP